MKSMSRTFPEALPGAGRGFAAVTAVFILVVLGALGAALVTISSGQHRGMAFDALGIQAFQAARTGIDRGAYEAINGGCGSGTPGFTLRQVTVNVQCSASAHEEASQSVTIYEIVATACNRTACPAAADGVSYVERQLRATVTDTAAGGL